VFSRRALSLDHGMQLGDAAKQSLKSFHLLQWHRIRSICSHFRNMRHFPGPIQADPLSLHYLLHEAAT